MISDKQFTANQKNAQLGGVKTVQGKEVSKYNALSHGLLRKTLTEYEKEVYLEIYADFIREYQPVTIFEKILVERATIYYLKLFRVQKAEQEYIKSRLDPHIERPAPWIDMTEFTKGEIVNEGYVPQITDEHIQKLSDVYTRYEVTLENRLYRAIHELERAIAIRKGEKLPTQNTVNILQMGSFRENG